MRRFIISTFFCLLISSTLVHAASNTPVASEESKISYVNSILEHINSNWKYLSEAENYKDFVVMKLKISRDGQVAEKTIVHNAKHKELDEEVMRQVTAMEPFPSMPPDFHKETAFVVFNHQFSPTEVKAEQVGGKILLKENKQKQ